MSVFDWSTSAGSNATADPNINWAEGMLPSAVNDSARATMAAIAAYVKDVGGFQALAGAGNAFAITLTQPMLNWTPGLFGFKASRSNSGAVTMSVNSLSPKPLRAISGTDLVSGQILIGAEYLCTYSSGGDEVLLIGKTGLVSTDFAPAPAGTVTANLSGSTAVPSNVALASFFGAAPAASIPSSAFTGGITGEVRAFAHTTVPTGWLYCNGQAVSRTTYATLFAAIGISYGSGDGTTTFNVPDMRGVFARGQDDGRGLDSGRTLGSFQSDDVKPHNHSINDSGHTHTVPVSTGLVLTGSVGVTAGTTGTSTTSSSTTGISINNSSGTESRPVNVSVRYCIAI